LVAKVVAANILTEETAKGLTVNALRELSTKIPTGSAANLVAGGFGVNANDDKLSRDLPGAA